ncbi:MAG TPA: hypothetical protein PK400_05020 [Phycisphaerales bacterium]|nr:hypothetical protein [Phycisphaerales bacterium]HRQ76033.1 hypothetical protein [Phycisphaerales bacterium]
MRTYLRSLIEQARRREEQTSEVDCAMDELASHAIRLARLAEAVHCFDGGSPMANRPLNKADAGNRRDELTLREAVA